MLVIFSLTIVLIGNIKGELPLTGCSFPKPFKITNHQCANFHEVCFKKNDDNCNRLNAACSQCPPTNITILILNEIAKSLKDQQNQIFSVTVFSIISSVLVVVTIVLLLIIMKKQFEIDSVTKKEFRKIKNEDMENEIKRDTFAKKKEMSHVMQNNLYDYATYYENDQRFLDNVGEINPIKYPEVFLWKIIGFIAAYNNYDIIFSPPFQTGPLGYKIRLLLYPRMFIQTNNNIFMTAFFQILPSENDEHLSWPMDLMISISILDKTGEYKLAKHYSYDLLPSKYSNIFMKPSAETYPTMEHHQSISFANYESQNFIIQDTIIIKCCVKKLKY